MPDHKEIMDEVQGIRAAFEEHAEQDKEMFGRIMAKLDDMNSWKVKVTFVGAAVGAGVIEAINFLW